MQASIPGTPVAIATPDLEIIEGHVTTTSQQIAEHFGKRHDTVLRAIRNLLAELPEDYRRNFAGVMVEFTNGKGGTQQASAYRLTRDGFVLLAMGFTGKEAMQWKVAYLTAFNKMEAQLLAQAAPAPADTGRRVRQQSRQMPLLPAPRRIRCRDDLSFTKRDGKGRLINWFMPERPGNWHEHYGIGEIWFNEIVELARHSPQEAYHAMLFAGPELIRYWNYGHPEGFFDRMARWALAAILANPTEPQLPFNLPRMGTPPREGMDFHLAAACNQRQEK